MTFAVSILKASTTIWLGLLLLVSLHILPMALLGRWFGLTVEQTKIGFGPSLLKARLVGAPLVFAAVPITGAVQFAEPDPALPGRRALNTLSLPKFVLVCLMGCLTLLVVGFACLGTGVTPLVETTLAAVWAILWSPISTVPAVAEKLAQALRGQSLVQSFGAAAVVIAVLNLLPIPPLNGWQVSIEPFRRVGLPEPVMKMLQMLGVAVLLYGFVLWAGIAVGMGQILLGYV
jgi:membrane-associated protease RseP (regulator of RpoE activity)